MKEWIVTKLQQPFNIGKKENSTALGKENHEIEIAIVIEMLTFSYIKNLNTNWHENIERSAVSCLHAIATNGPAEMKTIETQMQQMIDKHKSKKFARLLAFQREKILQQFYKVRIVTTDVTDAMQRITQLNNSYLRA